MENEKYPQQKSFAALSIGMLVVAVASILLDTLLIILTRGNFIVVLTEMTINELPVITKLFVVSIPTVAYVVFFFLLILVLVLKELFIRNKIVTLVVNVVTIIVAVLYVPVYMFAIFLPMIITSS